ncbi:MAG: type VI secretion system tip protein VgrG [Desulfobacteraceae bacterium]|nr:type VI secretion system tip protein VgrG [Desulfobacteraceae bacterium]
MIASNEEQFIFKLAGKKIPVYSFDVEEGISQIFNISVTLASPEVIGSDDAIGKMGVLTIRGDRDRYFHGIVKDFGQSTNQGKIQEYQLELVPLFWLLTLTRDVRIFQNLSTPEIIAKVLKDSDLTTNLYKFNLTGSYGKREYCVQYRETDFDFISRLLAEEGIFYYFEHAKELHKLIFADGISEYKILEGTGNIQFNTRGSLVENNSEYVTEISKTSSICSGKVSITDYNFKKPNFKFKQEKTGKTHTNLELYDYPGNFDGMARGKNLAEVKLGEANKFKDMIQGSSLVPTFAPCSKFTLNYHPSEEFNRQFLLTNICHNGIQSQVLGALTENDIGTSYGNSFKCIPPSVVFRPDYEHKKPSVEGVQTAMVTGPAGEEIYTDEYGRIKVQFHWDREGKKDEKTSCWMRVSQKLAGPGWGAVFIPRIGQEVIVDFLDGDPDRPIVTGAIYNGDNKPAYPLPDEKTKSTIRTQSTPGGEGYNEIRFEDKKGEEELYIQAEKDRTELIKNDSTTTVKNDSFLTVEKNRTTIIKGEKDSLSVEAGTRSISVKGVETRINSADLKHDITGNYTLNIGGNMDIKVAGSVTIQGQTINLNP